ncbi:MAG TPA: rhomboid family intramembrane serine protease [Clostridiales bacterium]|nr:rhomboid family intramembrane serine protease [Clostridiales bacterium]HPV02001.1 rhomboid family intramembrane serine protease [Clostridiales bacterium]
MWLDKLEKKIGKYCIKNLMLYITALNGVVFILQYLAPEADFVGKLMLVPSLVKQGEVWRLVTFLFIPMTFRPVRILFALYFYYLIGSSLEREWGSFKFNVYYFIGVLGTIAGAFLGGLGTSTFLNLSLIFAFAYLFPNYQIMIFYLFPVKVKYLALFYAAVLVFTFAFMPIVGLITVLGSAVNFILFFWKDIYYRLRFNRRAYMSQKEFKEKIPKIHVMHRCTICGITDVEDRKMDFRYCVECDGDYEYCMDHLYNHEHVKADAQANKGDGTASEDIR